MILAASPSKVWREDLGNGLSRVAPFLCGERGDLSVT